MKKNLTEVVFILDRSGSMSGLEGDTIGGFNSMLAQQKKEDGEALLSTVLFNDGSVVLHDRVPIGSVVPLTDRDYAVGGCTALLDAVGGAIRHIGHLHKAMPEEERPEKTLFIITTDGMENSSRRYTYDKVKKMVEKKKEKNHWEFVFLGANIDAVQVAGRFGVSANRAVRFENDTDGTELNYSVASRMISSARKASSAMAMHADYDVADYVGSIRADYEELMEMSAKTAKHPDYKSADIDAIKKNLAVLTGREREIMKMLYGLDGEKKHIYEEVAGATGTHIGRIRQIESKALRKIAGVKA
ncbi:MAG: hypothetical protein K6G16_06560 [Lachnospiraceae bacterium]|nr:hypothetical protein [Lachnospiraceae bacterium]